MPHDQKIFVKKRNGIKELLDPNKIHKVLEWACQGLHGVSVSDIEMHANLQFTQGVTTKDIHNILTRSASDLITTEFPNYQYVAGRLLNMSLRKDVLGKIDTLPHLSEVIAQGIKHGVYDKHLRDAYTDEDIDKINSFIKHDRDFKFTYAGLRQVIDKYLVQDRKSGKIFETPQYVYAIIAMVGFQSYDKLYNKETRLSTIKRFYDATSKFKLSLPTPVFAGVRTPVKQYASCVGIDIGDNLDSIYASNHALGRLTAQRAGMGVNYGRIRSKGAKVRGGEVIHTGIVPFMKITAAAVKSCSQNGIRGGSATCHIPCWHPEIEDVLVLKNNKGTEDNRIRTMDYSIQFWKGAWDRASRNEMIHLFDPHDSKHLSDAWGTAEFDALYNKECENHAKIRGSIPARALIHTFASERFSTGRMYYMDMDNANTHSSFNVPVRFSNLCFAPGTKVLTTEGTSNIVDLVGKEFEVPSEEEYLNSWVPRTRKAIAFESGVKAVIRVVLDNGFEFECTPDHPIALFKGGYKQAALLEPTDLLKSRDGATASGNFAIDIIDEGKVCKVYDLTVEDDHNFYITDGAAEILVHNCQEINLPSEPIDWVNGEKGEIFTCILAAINVADTRFEDLYDVTDLAVRFLDELIDHMEYAVPAAGRFSKGRRALGVGIIGLADLLAREKVKYSSTTAPYVVHPYAERFALGLTRSSINLAKDKGACEKYSETKYSQGLLPIDTYKKDAVDAICAAEPDPEWEVIRRDLALYGIRNSSLMAFMPAESSAVVSGTSNGVEALRSLVTTKTSKKGPIKSVAKYIEKYAKYYQLCWDKDYTNKGYLDVMSVWQKFADQGMSLNLYSDPRRYESGLVSIGDVIGDIKYASSLGHKQLYYQNTLDLSGEEEMEIDGEIKTIAIEASSQDGACESGACAI